MEQSRQKAGLNLLDFNKGIRLTFPSRLLISSNSLRFTDIQAGKSLKAITSLAMPETQPTQSLMNSNSQDNSASNNISIRDEAFNAERASFPNSQARYGIGSNIQQNPLT